jgi:hypothetical protein
MFEMNYDLLEYRSRFDIFTGKIHKPIYLGSKNQKPAILQGGLLLVV